MRDFATLDDLDPVCCHDLIGMYCGCTWWSTGMHAVTYLLAENIRVRSALRDNTHVLENFLTCLARNARCTPDEARMFIELTETGVVVEEAWEVVRLMGRLGNLVAA